MSVPNTGLWDYGNLIDAAQRLYDEWYDSPEIYSEVDSLSHEYVREVVPDLIEALRELTSHPRS